jgi:PPM family protein phosphatase
LPDYFPRDSVEDAYALVVADGLGGQACGELASLLALCVGWDLGDREINWLFKANAGEIPKFLEKLELFPRLIQKGLEKQIDANPSLAGMATTFTGMYTVGLEAFLTHVGDSRAYLYRDDTLQLLTRDQTLREDLIRAGVVSLDSAYLKRAHHILTGCLGDTSNKINPITAHVELKYGDQLLMCTDGLSNLVDDSSIVQILANSRTAVGACRDLIQSAIERGGKDNITVIVARYQEPRP